MAGSCDICGRVAECDLISSGCAPVSYSACAECDKRRAENVDVAALWVHLHGGAEIKDEHLIRLVAWLDGRYVGWPEILSYYEVNKASIIADLSAD